MTVTYFEIESHRHVYGANLAVWVSAYRLVGRARHLACSEDVALVNSLINAKCNVA
ncbi:hypothetical protein QFZ83_002397 [Variovorax sp. W1I1]|uniref:hypothetical protein n=1 Tax=Variovorax sp. W1I1 TaxID=3042309 RepID=UPI00277DE014|nr:hypothetical protein [Variovorax sp. W1I1]MDQ0608226.1 hypothetical protein [Variovorax sp. W1I1]